MNDKQRLEELLYVIGIDADETQVERILAHFNRRGYGIHLQDNDFKYLVGKNLKGEGFFIIWDGEKSLGQLDIDVFRTIAKEAKSGCVKPPYHVYARYQLYQSPNVLFYQIPDKILAHLGLNENSDRYNNEEEE